MEDYSPNISSPRQSGLIKELVIQTVETELLPYYAISLASDFSNGIVYSPPIPLIEKNFGFDFDELGMFSVYFL